MEVMDRFAWNMRNVPGVQQVVTLADVGRIVTAGYNEGSLKWRALPRNTEVMRQSLSSVETDSGLIDSPECRAMPIMVFTEDPKAETITRVVDAVKAFLAQKGELTDRVMAAMEAADALGGDRRCSCDTAPKTNGPCLTKTSHVAYILLAEKTDRNKATYNDGDYAMFIPVTEADIKP